MEGRSSEDEVDEIEWNLHDEGFVHSGEFYPNYRISHTTQRSGIISFLQPKAHIYTVKKKNMESGVVRKHPLDCPICDEKPPDGTKMLWMLHMSKL